MEERNRLIELYNIYQNLLTDIERKYFEYYYFEDYSLSEIAEIFDVSKSYSGKIINKIEDKLEYYEENMKIFYNKNKLRMILNLKDIDNIKRKIEEIL